MAKKNKHQNQQQIAIINKSTELKLIQGTATLADLMAPPSIEFENEYFKVGDLFCTSMTVTFYPREMYPGWMQTFTSMDLKSDISLHIHPVDKKIVDFYLKRKIAGIQSTQQIEAKKGKIASVEDQANMDDIELVRYKLFVEKENFFQVTLMANIYGNTKEELENNISFFMNSIKELGIDVKILKMQQKKGIESILPFGRDTVKSYHNFYTSALATSFPFTQANIQVEGGILYGESMISRTPVFYDIFNKNYNDNYNKVIIGWSGSGKSFTSKLLASRYAIRGTKVMVIDPTTQEYVGFARRLGGQVIDISPKSPSVINPFDLAQTRTALSSDLKSNAESLLANKIQYLTGLFEIMLDGKIEKLEKALIDKALILTYFKKGIYAENPDTFGLEPPTMHDFDEVLNSIIGIKTIINKYNTNKNSLTPLEISILKYPAFRTNSDLLKAASGLRIKIEPFISGSLSQMFRGQTNVVLSNRVVVFNVGNAPESQIPLSMYIVFGEILNNVLAGGGKKESIVILDEAWKILRHSGAATSVQTLIKEGRKMLCSTWLISQELADYKDSKQGLTALRNASVKILLKSTPAAMEEQKEFFRLSEGNAAYLTKASPGEAMMLIEKNQSLVAFYARPTESEQKMASTTYSELKEIEKIQTPQIAADFNIIQNEEIDSRTIEHLHAKAQLEFGEAIIPEEDQTTNDDIEEIFAELFNDL